MKNSARFPILYNENLTQNSTIRPISLSVELSLTPLSSATITLPVGEELPVRRFVQIFTPVGSVGFFRTRSPEIAFGEGISTTVLEHAITEVGDYCIRGKVEGEMTIRAAMSAVFNHYRGELWQLGDVSALDNDSDNKIDVDYDHTNVLQTMLEVLEQDEDCVMMFDFSTTPWTVYFENIDDSTLVTEGRLTRNIQSATVTYDDTDLCTYALYCYGGDSWGVLSAPEEYRDLYGRVEKVVETDSGDSQAVAKNKARIYLKRNREPKLSIQISADDLYAVTGRREDRLELGKIYRLAIPDKGVDIKRYITGLSWGDVFGNPSSVNVTLGDDSLDLWAYMRKYAK